MKFEAPCVKPHCAEVYAHLQAVLPGRNLIEVASEHQIPIRFGSKINKGWVGQTIEKVAGLKTNSEASSDGADFELKTTEIVHNGHDWVPKETLKITQLNPHQILEEGFFESIFWEKLGSLIIVAYASTGENFIQTIKILQVKVTQKEIISEIRSFWEDVRHSVCSGEFKSVVNLGSSASFIQLRPLGDGKQKSICPITGESFPARAFYATKKLITLLMNTEAL